MLKQVIERFEAEFGRTVKTTQYVRGLEPRLDVGVEVEQEGARTRTFAHIWAPHPARYCGSANAVEYSHTEGRHSNAYSLTGLRKGMAALRFKIENPVQLKELIRFVRALPSVRGVAASVSSSRCRSPMAWVGCRCGHVRVRRAHPVILRDPPLRDRVQRGDRAIRRHRGGSAPLATALREVLAAREHWLARMLPEMAPRLNGRRRATAAQGVCDSWRS